MAAKRRLPYIPLFTADFLGGVRFLTPHAIGVYIQLLCVEWESGPLPNDKVELERIVRGFGVAWPELAEKFQIDGKGRLFNERLEEEREYLLNKSNAGKAGSKARWGGS